MIEPQQVWKGIAIDFEVLARLHATELDANTLRDLWQAEFPSSMILHLGQVQPIDDVFRKALQEIRLSYVSFDELAADFAAIYLNGTYQASPNESPWIDEDQLERQEPMFEIRNWYTKYGLTTSDWRRRQDDNLSLQLRFIAHLLNLESIPFRDLADFMDFHLLRWIDVFAERVFQRADTAFYASLATLTAQSLHSLRQVVADVEGRAPLSKEMVEQLSKKDSAPEAYDPRFYSSLEGGW